MGKDIFRIMPNVAVIIVSIRQKTANQKLVVIIFRLKSWIVDANVEMKFIHIRMIIK